MSFPKFIHIVRENEGTEDEFLSAFEGEAKDALTSTKRTQVATYERKVVQEGALEPTFFVEVG